MVYSKIQVSSLKLAAASSEFGSFSLIKPGLNHAPSAIRYQLADFLEPYPLTGHAVKAKKGIAVAKTSSEPPRKKRISGRPLLLWMAAREL